MMKRLYVIVSMLFVVIATAVAIPQVASAACQKQDQVLGVTTWYRGLQKGADCSVAIPTSSGSPDFVKFVTMVALNIVQAGLAIVAYVAIFFIIKGGFMYMTSAGSSDGMAGAKKTIMNAVIGLVIALLSASIVNAIAGALS